MDHVISERCYKVTILQRNYKKMTILWSFSYYSYVKFHGKEIFGSHKLTLQCYIKICVITRCIINGRTALIVLPITIKVIFSKIHKKKYTKLRLKKSCIHG